MRKILLLTVLLMFVSMSNVFASDEVKVFVRDVTDTRSMSSSRFHLDVNFIGEIAQEAIGITNISIKKAVDDSGRDLRKDSQGNNFRESRGNIIQTRISLESPRRSSQSIEVVSGVVEFYVPKNDKNSNIEVESFMTLLGQPIESDILKENNIELIVLTKDEYQEYNKTQADAKDAGGKMAEGFAQIFGNMFGGSSSDYDLFIAIKDPSKRLIKIQLCDKDGGEIDDQGTSWGTDYIKYRMKNLPDAEAKMIVYIKTSDSLVKKDFTIKNIPLP